MSKKGSVLVGMSGGVDSSVAAYLLMQQGYEVVGLTMDLWHNDEDPKDIYRNLSDAKEAKEVCDTLGIEHIAMNYTMPFRHSVEDHFAAEYRRGRTPNPCVVCNRHIKWEAMLKVADERGIEMVATGHYARIVRLENGRYSVARAAYDPKDQTYVLYGLTQDQLKRTILPIGEYDKPSIREIAKEAHLTVASKADSQDICFIDDGDYAGYLERKWSEESAGTIPPEGDFISTDGRVLGRHRGIHHYTIGQRKGLGISGEHPYFVCSINPDNDTVVLGKDEDVFCDKLIASDVNYLSCESFDPEKIYQGRIRYSHRGSDCRIRTLDDGRIEADFLSPVRAVTGGQAFVIYDKDVVVGGATIES